MKRKKAYRVKGNLSLERGEFSSENLSWISIDCGPLFPRGTWDFSSQDAEDGDDNKDLDQGEPPLIALIPMVAT